MAKPLEMIRAFIANEASGPSANRFGGWVLIAFLAINEARGIFVAYEGARIIGWL